MPRLPCGVKVNFGLHHPTIGIFFLVEDHFAHTPVKVGSLRVGVIFSHRTQQSVFYDVYIRQINYIRIVEERKKIAASVGARYVSARLVN